MLILKNSYCIKITCSIKKITANNFGTFKIFSISSTDIVNCISLDSCGWYMISGSRDCTSVVWDVSNANNINPKPFQTLLGHDLPVTCVAIATELDMAVSGSQDGTVNVYSIHQGLLVHCLVPLGCISPPSVISFVTISFQGHIAFSANDKVISQ